MKSWEKNRRRVLPPITSAPTSTRRNHHLMALLELVDEFQKDIAALRKEVGIPPRGVQPDFDEHDPDTAILKASDKALDLGMKLGYFSSESDKVQTSRKKKPFEIGITRIGEKFRLPLNLYNRTNAGIALYALSSHITVPEDNWEIDVEFGDDKRIIPNRWAAIKAYSLLDEKEATKAIKALNKTLKEILPATLSSPRKVKTDLERNLIKTATIIEERKRTGVGRTVYAPNSYLDIIRKRGANKKQMRAYEKLHPGSVISREPISERDRKILERADRLAKDIFGYGIKL